MMNRYRLQTGAGAASAIVTLSLALAGATAGCGGPAPQKAADTAAETRTDPVIAERFPSGTCTVTITGAVQLSFSSTPSPSNFHTDYWWSEAKTRRALAAQAEEDPDIAAGDEPWWVDQRASTDPVFTPLLISCVGPEGGVILSPGLGSRYADVPFAPRAYELSPGPGPEDVVRGHFAAVVHLNEGANALKFIVSKPGVLTVTEFDHDRIAGTFSFVALGEGKQEITVEGTFAYKRPAVG